VEHVGLFGGNLGRPPRRWQRLEPRHGTLRRDPVTCLERLHELRDAKENLERTSTELKGLGYRWNA
jgi:hypothetical protein